METSFPSRRLCSPYPTIKQIGSMDLRNPILPVLISIAKNGGTVFGSQYQTLGRWIQIWIRIRRNWPDPDPQLCSVLLEWAIWPSCNLTYWESSLRSEVFSSREKSGGYFKGKREGKNKERGYEKTEKIITFFFHLSIPCHNKIKKLAKQKMLPLIHLY